MAMGDLSMLKGVAYLAIVWLAYRVGIALYNISPYHPLARFPGPKIATASYLYEAYYDWWLVGRYGKVIARMHERYGTFGIYHFRWNLTAYRMRTREGMLQIAYAHAEGCRILHMHVWRNT
jgi:hypothetical protein